MSIIPQTDPQKQARVHRCAEIVRPDSLQQPVMRSNQRWQAMCPANHREGSASRPFLIFKTGADQGIAHGRVAPSERPHQRRVCPETQRFDFGWVAHIQRGIRTPANRSCGLGRTSIRDIFVLCGFDIENAVHVRKRKKSFFARLSGLILLCMCGVAIHLGLRTNGGGQNQARIRKGES